MVRAAWGAIPDEDESPPQTEEIYAASNASKHPDSNPGGSTLAQEHGLLAPNDGSVASSRPGSCRSGIVGKAVPAKKQDKLALSGSSPARIERERPVLRYRAFVPLHGLLFVLGELHMKTPEEILAKVKIGQI